MTIIYELHEVAIRWFICLAMIAITEKPFEVVTKGGFKPTNYQIER